MLTYAIHVHVRKHVNVIMLRYLLLHVYVYFFPLVEENCKNSNENCAYWAKTHQCKINAAYMEKQCPLACGLCGSAADQLADGVISCKSELT